MAMYKRGYSYIPEDEQEIKQKNRVDIDIENEQENEVESKTAQNDKNFARITQTATNINVSAAGTGQTATIGQANGADTNSTDPTQANAQDVDNIPVVVPINNADQAGRDLTD